MLATFCNVAIGVRSTWTGLAQFGRYNWLPAVSEWISNASFRAVAHWVTRRVAHRSEATRVRLAWIPWFNTTSDRVGTLDVSTEACALGKAVVQYRALRVRSTWRRFAWVVRQFAWHLRWISFVFWQTEAGSLSVDLATSGVWSTGIWCALVSFWNAILERVSGRSLWTEAYRATGIDLAHGVQATWIRIARIAGWTTSQSAVSAVSWWTFTLRFVISNIA